MRKVYFLLLLCIITLSCNQQAPKKEKASKETAPEYSIGINFPLSGNGSYFAEEYKKGMDLAFAFANEGDRIRVNALYEDNKMNPMEAVGITKKFIEIDKVDLLVFGYTPIIQATIGLAEKGKVPALAVLSSAADIAANYEWVYRDFGLESQMMPLLAEFAFQEMGLRKGSWLVINDDMGHDAVRFFNEKFAALGGQLADGETFESSETDLRNKINKVMGDEPAFILVIGRGSAMMNACRQIRERNTDIPVFGTNSLDNSALWDALGEAGINFWFASPYVDMKNNRYQRANERFRDKFDSDMNWLNIYGFSTANYLLRGLRDAGGDKAAMRNYLQTLNVETIRGQLQMDQNHDVLTPHLVYKRENGRSVPASASVLN